MMKYDFQSEVARAFPSMVIVDVTNVCNMRCVHCPHGMIIKDASYRATFMPESRFRKIVDEVSSNSTDLLRIASDGESLLHPHIVNMLGYAKEMLKCPVNLTTNGLLLDESMALSLIDIGLDIVDVSIDAFSTRTYDQVRKGGDYGRVVENTLRLIELRNARGTSMKVMVSIIDQPLVKHEVEPFKSFWESKADMVLVRKFNDCHGMVGAPAGKPSDGRWPCPQLWKRITITCEGHIKYCVEDWLNKTSIACIDDTTIKEMWTGTRYEELRRKHLAGDYEGIVLCAECRDWRNSPWDYGYDHALRKLGAVKGGGS